MSGFQVKPMSFHIAIHFFNPHAPLVDADQVTPIGAVRNQIPGFIFALFPMENEPELTRGVFFSQIDPTDVTGLSRLQAQLTDFGPGLVGATDLIAALLTDDKMPALVAQPLQQMHRLKATIPDDPNLSV